MRPTKLVLLSVAALALVFLPRRSSPDKLATKEKPAKGSPEQMPEQAQTKVGGNEVHVDADGATPTQTQATDVSVRD